MSEKEEKTLEERVKWLEKWMNIHNLLLRISITITLLAIFLLTFIYAYNL